MVPSIWNFVLAADVDVVDSISTCLPTGNSSSSQVATELAFTFLDGGNLPLLPFCCNLRGVDVEPDLFGQKLSLLLGAFATPTPRFLVPLPTGTGI